MYRFGVFKILVRNNYAEMKMDVDRPVMSYTRGVALYSHHKHSM